MYRPRDNQRARVWRAIDSCPKTPLTGQDAFVLAVRTTQSKRVQRACVAGTTLSIGKLPNWAKKNTHNTLMYVAWIITNRRYGMRVQRHGWECCSIYLELVRIMEGQPAHDALKGAFKRERVKFRKPRAKKHYTDEDKLIFRSKLTKIPVEILRAQKWLDEIAGKVAGKEEDDPNISNYVPF